jgi:UTP--glucose-1-phosphate uridylyltransferase
MASVNKLNWAVIPSAGLGTRLLPVTRSVPKAMLPIGNYPLIHFAVKEAVSIGIENILIIIGDGMDPIRNYFTENQILNKKLESEGNTKLLDLQNEITNFADIRFLLQEKPLGVGQAIKLTKRIIGDNPFSVILPDDLIFAKPNALDQLYTIYKKYKGHVVGLNNLKNNEIQDKGIVSFTEEIDRYKINQLIEKPNLSEAPSKTGILGRYIFESSIFDQIVEVSDNEVNVTDALMAALAKTNVSGKIIEGYHFDTGTPKGLVKASSFFLKNSKLILEKY